MTKTNGVFIWFYAFICCIGIGIDILMERVSTTFEICGELPLTAAQDSRSAASMGKAKGTLAKVPML